MGKTLSDLEKSREIRKKVIAKYGFIPTSIIEPDYNWGKHIVELDSRKQQAVALEKHKKMDYDRRLTKAFSMSSQNVRGKQGGLSTFPPDLARFIVEFYSEKGDLVGDPFAGHNSRLQVTAELGRSYTGYDICHEFQELNRKIAKQVQGSGKQSLMFTPEVEITLREQTSEKMAEPDETFDMFYSSPPYSIEYYDDHPDQIGTDETYEQMMRRLKTVLLECYRTLKKGKFCIWNINDFRKDGVFYPFHCDTVKMFQEVGFKLHDIIVVKWQSCIGQAFASQIESRKVTAKAHEFLVVGKKG